MRNKFIKLIEKYGMWIFAIWITLVVLVFSLSSCTEVKERNDKRDNAIQIKSKIYKTDGVWEQHIEV